MGGGGCTKTDFIDSLFCDEMFGIMYHKNALNSSPNVKIPDWSKLTAFADNKLDVAKMMISLFDRLENTLGKGENAGLPAFTPFSTEFFKAVFLGVIKSWNCMVKN